MGKHERENNPKLFPRVSRNFSFSSTPFSSKKDNSKVLKKLKYSAQLARGFFILVAVNGNVVLPI
jgi:hypothetical protein